ncbi:MAG: HIRAN domain-containing protein [Lachnospiraceae bacterium]|nr:HIRAN domain-containing protein [Lachnospiraceae bacterium]
MENNIINSEKAGIVSALETHDLGEIIKPMIREIHLFDTYVAGTSYLSDTSVLEVVKSGDELTLRREDNKFDSNAILVLNAELKKLGYIPEKDNVVFARLMDAGKILKAKVTNVEKIGSFTQISIGIYLADL